MDSVQKIDAIDGLDHIQFENFRVFGWIDCVMMLTYKLGDGPIDDNGNRREGYDELQRAYYTTYGHQWGMKNQGVLIPNGMIACIFTVSIFQNDKGMVNTSGVAEEMLRVL